MADTLLLSQDIWDLVLDISGNIAMATAPYAVAQDVASACRTFAGEAWYDTTQGVPYFSDILGQPLNTSFIKSKIEAAALTVPDVVSARCTIVTFQGRELRGQVEIIDTTGAQNNVQF
jgi:hypothetical protein